MALVVKDRVQETSTTTGTGTLTLAGAVTGFQTFSNAIGNTNTTYYTIQNSSEWEVGIGTVSAGALSRDTVLESSNSGSLVNFSAGSKFVFCTYPAEKSVDIETAQTLTNKTISGASNTLSNIANSSLTNSAITINGTSTSLGSSINVGTVTSVTGTAPIVSSGGNTPAISMAAATTSVNGYLTSTDWNTFNGKQTALVSGTSIKTVNGTTLLGSGDVGVIDISHGGTNNGSLAVTAGGLVYTDGTKLVNVGAGTTGQALISNGASAPAWVSSGFRTVIFASSGSWSVPSGVTQARVTVIGGGGGARDSGTSSSWDGGDGGFAQAYITGLSGSITITVGAGGNSGGTATAGGTSSFGSYVSSTGGTAGTTTVNGVDGAGTVSTGTALRATSSVPTTSFSLGILGGSQIPAGGTKTGLAWSPTDIYGAGQGGNGSSTTTSTAGIGGIVMIEY